MPTCERCRADMGPWPVAHRCKCATCGGILDVWADPEKRCRCGPMKAPKTYGEGYVFSDEPEPARGQA